jgi:hypothetical protein
MSRTIWKERSILFFWGSYDSSFCEDAVFALNLSFVLGWNL